MHASIADIVADVAANSIEAAAKLVRVSLVERDGWLTVSVSDDGKGMSPDVLARAFDPFYTEPGKHAERKIGMGLPFLKQTCDACEGDVTLESEVGKGTRLVCTFRQGAFDLPPMGDLAATALALFGYPGSFELVFSHERNGASYAIVRTELSEAVGGFEDVTALALAREFLRSQEESL